MTDGATHQQRPARHRHGPARRSDSAPTPWNPQIAAFTHATHGDVAPEDAPRLNVHGIDDSLFATLGMTMRAGRAIAIHDHAASEPVVVISEALRRE